MKIPLWSSMWIRATWNFSPRALASSTVKMVDFPNIWQQCRLKLDGYGCWSFLPSPQTAKNDFNFSSNISHVKTCRVRVPQPTSQILPYWFPFPPNQYLAGRDEHVIYGGCPERDCPLHSALQWKSLTRSRSWSITWHCFDLWEFMAEQGPCL